MADKSRRVDKATFRGFAVDKHRFFFSQYKCGEDNTGYDSGEEDDDERSRVVTSRTEWGQMIDFIKNNQTVTIEQYKWELTIPQIKIASHDFTHVEYIRDKKSVHKKPIGGGYDNPYDFVNDLGLPIFKQEK